MTHHYRDIPGAALVTVIPDVNGGWSVWVGSRWLTDTAAEPGRSSLISIVKHAPIDLGNCSCCSIDSRSCICDGRQVCCRN